jgi:hypothetical protein
MAAPPASAAVDDTLLVIFEELLGLELGLVGRLELEGFAGFPDVLGVVAGITPPK